MIVLNGSDPYTAVYPPHEEGRAGMSFVHLLVLPKRHIYNAVSLQSTDIPLLHEMAEGVRTFVADQANRTAIATRIKAQIGRNAMFKGNPELEELLEADIEKYVADGDAPSNVEFYFHVHPNHSVGYLHMHAIAGNMRSNSTMSHDNKNTPMDVIIEALGV
jgi:diadenosine tetraphosphate (Ap4A) HIT family hydrolase